MEKKNIGLIVLIIIFSALLVALSGYFVYDKLLNNKDVDNNYNNDMNGDINNEDSNLNNIRNSIENIVEEELYILWNKNNISEITAQERLQVALERYARDNGLDLLRYEPETVSATDLENAYYKTSCTINPLVHQNILLYEKVDSFTEIRYTYDDDNEIYKVNQVDKGAIKIEPTYSNVVEFKQLAENEYSISYQYLFTWINHSEVDNNVYFSYIDAKNQVNGIKVFDNKDTLNSGDELKNELDDYVEDNYDKIKDKLITHNYVFSYEFDKYNLKNFYLS